MNSGIYKITNIKTGKFYIGSTKNLNYRKTTHINRLANNVHPNKHLQFAWNKYGEQNFIFEVLENCSPELLLRREQVYLDEFKPYNRKIGYNMSEKAESPYSTNNKKVVIVYKDGSIASIEKSIESAANRLGVSRETVRRKLRSGNAIGKSGCFRVFDYMKIFNITVDRIKWKSNNDITFKNRYDRYKSMGHIVISKDGVFLYKTLKEIGEKYNLTRERIRQRENPFYLPKNKDAFYVIKYSDLLENKKLYKRKLKIIKSQFPYLEYNKDFVKIML